MVSHLVRGKRLSREQPRLNLVPVHPRAENLGSYHLASGIGHGGGQPEIARLQSGHG